MTKFPSLLLALACLTTASVHAQLLDRNLIVNGDAESGPGTSTTTIVPIPGWTVVGTNLPLARRYGSIGTVYTSATPGPINRGNNFFLGGSFAAATMFQIVDVSSVGPEIDAGLIQFNLSGWVGGVPAEGDSGKLVAEFRNDMAAILGTSTLPPALKYERSGLHTMLFRERIAPVPPGTRSVVVTAQFDWDGSFNYAALDNLSLVLSQPITGGPPRIRVQPQAQYAPLGYDVTFNVTLEGAAPFSYQWLRNGQLMLGETGPQFRILQVQPTHAADYSVVIANESGTVTSQPATLRVTTFTPFGQLAWYRAEGNANDSAGNNHATLRNGATIVPNGLSGQAFSFTGGNQAVATAGPVLTNAYGQLTLEAWVYPTQHGHDLGQPYGRTVVARTDVDGFALRVYDGQLQPDLRLTSGNALFQVGPVLPLNTWTHLAVTYDGSSIASYINGALVDSRPFTGTIRNTANTGTVLAIGNDPNVGTFTSNDIKWLGLIDEVGIHARAMSATELAAIFAARELPRIFTKTTVAAHYTWSNFAGPVGGGGRHDGVGSEARFTPNGCVYGLDGKVYVVDWGQSRIISIAADGTAETVSGNGVGWLDGPVETASFDHPLGIAKDSFGNFFVTDTYNHVIRKISAGGMVTTIAGNPTVRGAADGVGTNALFYEPKGIAVAKNGDLIVSEYRNHAIRRVTQSGVVTTIAGQLGVSGYQNGTGTNALFSYPGYLALDANDNIYFPEDNMVVRKVTPSGDASLYAGVPVLNGVASFKDGPAATARFDRSAAVVVDPIGNVYVSDTVNNRVRLISTAGIVSTIAGGPGAGDWLDGLGTNSRFNLPSGITIDPSGNLYVSDNGNTCLRKITPTGQVTTLAGAAAPHGLVNGTGPAVRFYTPKDLLFDGVGNLLVSDSDNNAIRMITPAGVVSTYLGGTRGTNDGVGTAARLYDPAGMVLDPAGNLYICDSRNHTIRRASPGGIVTTVAGSPGLAGTQDGTGNAARFNYPDSIARDQFGNLYVTDSANHTIRKITPAGDVSTLAGAPGTPGSIDGLGGAARFNTPLGIVCDGASFLYVADHGSIAIRRVSLAGDVTTLAGRLGVASSGTAQDGIGTNAFFEGPTRIIFDRDGSLLVSQDFNRIRHITLDGVVTSFNPDTSTGSLDGYGNDVGFNNIEGMALDGSGRLFIADAGLHRIRVGTDPTIIYSPQPVTVLEGAPATFQVIARGTEPFQFQWLVDGIPIGGATNQTYTITAALTNHNGNYSVIVSNARGVAHSADARLRVGVPIVLAEPQDRTTYEGLAASFSIVVTGPGSYSYQWLFKGAPISGANASSYSIPAVRLTDAGIYQVQVSNPYGTTFSAVVTLTVLRLGAPNILNQPADQVVSVGAAAQFSVGAVGVAPLQYQWLENGVPVPRATNSTYTTPVLGTNGSSVYSVTVSNQLGAVTSTNALLTVWTVPVVARELQSQRVPVGARVTFTVVAGGANLSYTWVHDSSFIPAATGPSLTITNAQLGDAGTYLVAIANPTGLGVISSATLTVDQGATVVTHPQSQTRLLGTPATFGVGALGEPALQYQWLFKGADLPGETNATLSLPASGAGSGGDYAVRVQNAFGSTVSSNATLTVVGPALGLSFSGPDAVVTLLPPVPGLILESTDGFGAAPVWTTVTNINSPPPTNVLVPWDRTTGSRFFRLRTP